MSEQRVEIDLRERERRLYDRLRDQLIRTEPGSGSSVRDLILVLPDLVVLLFRLARDPRVPAGAKLLAAVGLGYVVSPIDVLPEFLFGPFGLIDDVLVVAWALSQILNRTHPDLVRAHWSGQGDALDAIRRMTAWAESTVGTTLSRVLGFRSTPT